MKKIITFCAAILMTASVFAQAPEKMSYQAVIRDAGNTLITDQAIGMQISILQGSIFGASVYVETQAPNTNNNGLVSIEIGSGTVVNGTFNTIDWSSGPYFIKTETDPTGGTSYTITGTSQLLSVPYALFAKNSSGWQTIDDTTHTLNQVGIGTASSYPGVELVLSDDVFASQVIETSGTTTDAEIWLKNPKGVWRMHGDQSDGNKLKFGLWTDYSEAGGSNILSKALTIDTLGRVGMGTTSPKERLQLGDKMFIHAEPVVQAIMYNQFWNGGNWEYASDNAASGIEFNSSNSGAVAIWTAVNGISGNQVLPLSRIMILNNGNVGINTTTPARSLHISDVMRLEPRASSPSSPAEGDIYMDSTTHKLMVYDGSTWQACW
ncbi:hypothetical protein N8364_03400 [Saprospiraceae bacterium]|nr:hypothetical protein [Saprospiraceae bacterium]MDB4163239.1 hypothetical protein [Saprospiraceae bacterium]MDC1508698.1 hypothetical protein [Saprospiraceae bacterium]